MIDVQYKKDKDFIHITVKTHLTESGTFHKIAAVFFVIGWDIVSGSLESIYEEGVEFTYDKFKIRPPENQTNNQIVHNLAFMMESILSTKESVEDLLKRFQLEFPHPSKFFDEEPIFVFKDIADQDVTRLYMEAGSARGLLFHLTKVLKDFQINIINASIETDDKTLRAKDTFFLLDGNGNMFANTPLVEKIKTSILTPIMS